MELKRIKEEIYRLEAYKADDSITDSGLELLAELTAIIAHFKVNKNALLHSVTGGDLDCNCNKMFNELIAIYYRSLQNGLVDVDTHDRLRIKKLLKL